MCSESGQQADKSDQEAPQHGDQVPANPKQQTGHGQHDCELDA